MTDRIFDWLAAHPRTTDTIGRIADAIEPIILWTMFAVAIWALTR